MQVTWDLGDVPAWIQAVGALVGIGAAYLIARGDVAARPHAAESARRRFLASVQATASNAYFVLEVCSEVPADYLHRSRFEAIYSSEDFEAALRALRAIPLHELGDLALVQLLIRLESIIERVRKDLEERAFAAQTDPAQEVRGLEILKERRTLAWNAAEGVSRRITELNLSV